MVDCAGDDEKEGKLMSVLDWIFIAASCFTAVPITGMLVLLLLFPGPDSRPWIPLGDASVEAPCAQRVARPHIG